MGQFSLTHLLILAVIALLFFGPSRLPQLGQGLGRAIRGFKEGLSGTDPDSQKDQRSVGSNTPEQLEASQRETELLRQKEKERNGRS